MGKFFTAVKRGFQAMGEAPAGERFTVGGQSVTCLHCSHDRFVEGHAQINTAGLTFFNLDWANRSAATVMCTSCGRTEWYLADPFDCSTGASTTLPRSTGSPAAW